MLWLAVFVFLNEAVRRLHDAGVGTVVPLQIQNLRAGIEPVKAGEGLGKGRPEAVDALVLVAHHEDVLALGGEKMHDPVLDFGSILGLVHTEILIPLLDLPEERRMAAQNFQGIDHLVIVVHAPALPERCAVGPVKGWEIHALHRDLRELFLPQHLVFHIGNCRAQSLDRSLRGKLPRPLAVQLSQ